MPEFSVKRSAAHRDLHSFPTRRSSDLERRREEEERAQDPLHAGDGRRTSEQHDERDRGEREQARRARREPGDLVGVERRSEEHTSELQSHSDLVCRLLLEKKKQKLEKV